MMLLQFGVNISCLLLSIFMGFNFFFELSLYFMKLILSLFSLDFSDSFFIKTVIPDLFGNLILNFLALIILFLLLWCHWLGHRRLEWTSSALLCQSRINFFFNRLLNSFLDMFLKTFILFNISEWLNSLIDHIRIKTGLFILILLDNFFSSLDGLFIRFILGIRLRNGEFWFGSLIFNWGRFI